MNECIRVCRFRVGGSEACLCVRLVIVARSRWARSTFVLRAARFVGSILSVVVGTACALPTCLVWYFALLRVPLGSCFACATAFFVHEHADLTVVSSLLPTLPALGD